MNKQLKVAVIVLTAIPVLFSSITAFADSPGTPVNCEANRFSFGQNMVLASSREALFKLTGTGWTRMSLPGNWEQVRVVGDDTVYLYSNETHNLFRSPDGGLHWTLVTTSPFPDYVTADFFVAPDNSTLFLSVLDSSSFPNQRGIWRSLDDGVTWQRTLDTSEYTSSIISPLAFSPAFSQDGTAFASQTGRGTFMGIWRSTDFGRSWSSANCGMQVPAQYAPPTWLTISPQFAQDGTVFSGGASFNRGFYKSTNTGTTWQFTGTLSPIATALSPNYLADQVILIADAGTGVHLSSDGGTSFSTVWSRTGALIVGLRQVNTPFLEYWVVAQGTQPGICYLYRSSDQGVSWEPQVLFQTPYAVYLPIIG
jgi:photosystem II stability/assembly factor-like uncharacterized protein